MALNHLASTLVGLRPLGALLRALLRASPGIAFGERPSREEREPATLPGFRRAKHDVAEGEERGVSAAKRTRGT